ncbi:MAG: hypothetical protein ACJ77N_08795, partial [Chloroflexota bacterium]
VTAMARDTADGVYELDDLERYPRDFVIAHAHRVPYDLAVRLAGGRLVPVGDAAGATRGQVEDALTDSVAAVIHVLKGDVAAEFASLRDVTRLARERGIPVIVDAAAQLPPVENLWRFGENGADVTLFSGGKGLCGPASTGLVLGASVFVERISRNASPLHRIGRPMKVGKEDLVGILTAVEWFVGQDHVAVAARYRDAVAHIVDWGRGRADVEVMAEATGEAGQPTPRARIRVGPASPLSRDALAVSLRATPPRIDLLLDGEDLLYVAPETLVPGEERLITRKLDALLGAGSSAQPAAGAVD